MPTPKPSHRLRLGALTLLLLAVPGVLPVGCATSASAGRAPQPVDVRTLPMFAGAGGEVMMWGDLLEAIGEVDVIIVGERHNDAVGHAFQLALVEDAGASWPGTALSLEMLERDEQPIVDDYTDEIVDAEQFAVLTRSTNWGEKGRWDDWYQPIIDAAHGADGPIVAANAPRRYVRFAREGYEGIEALSEPRRSWVELPQGEPDEAYRRRFAEAMGVEGHDAVATDSADDDAEEEASEHADGEAAEQEGGDAEPEWLEGMFRAQLVWDATMADSIARALDDGADKVVHLVGGFHCEYDGALVQELRRRAPDARILVVAMVPEPSSSLRAEDEGRGDVVVYTGGRD